MKKIHVHLLLLGQGEFSKDETDALQQGLQTKMGEHTCLMLFSQSSSLEAFLGSVTAYTNGHSRGEEEKLITIAVVRQSAGEKRRFNDFKKEGIGPLVRSCTDLGSPLTLMVVWIQGSEYLCNGDVWLVTRNFLIGNHGHDIAVGDSIEILQRVLCQQIEIEMQKPVKKKRIVKRVKVVEGA